jgi:hypothetical protein
MQKVFRYIKSDDFAIVIAVASVLVQSFHSFTAFYRVSSLNGTLAGVIQAVIFALVIDAAILFYTVRSKKDVVLFASVFLVLINGYYYWVHFQALTPDFIFGVFVSILIPVTQYYYSEEITGLAFFKDDRESELTQTNLKLFREKIELETKVGELSSEATDLKHANAILKTELSDFLEDRDLISSDYKNLKIAHEETILANSAMSRLLGEAKSRRGSSRINSQSG